MTKLGYALNAEKCIDNTINLLNYLLYLLNSNTIKEEH